MLSLALAAFLGAPAPRPAVISVFGHKIPDTDAICAAICYTWELEQRGVPARAFRLGELNRETEYVLATFGVEAPPLLEGALEEGAPVAVVDTNNPKELPDGIEHAALHSVIDHHKLAGLTSPAVPTEIDIRSLCSTGSILYARAKAAGRTPSPQVAGLLLSCILSDSLEFRSPTTTELDKELAIELAAIAGVDLHAHARAMLDAKAEVGHLSPTELIMMDSKQYEIGGRNLRISVVETTRPEKVLSQRAALQTAMKEVAADQKLDDVLLFVVDVLQEQATFIGATDSAAAIVEQAWGVAVDNQRACVLEKVLSRKKQIVPMLEAGARKPKTAATQKAAVTPDAAVERVPVAA